MKSKSESGIQGSIAIDSDFKFQISNNSKLQMANSKIDTLVNEHRTSRIES